MNLNGVSIARFSYVGANLISFERTQSGEAETERYIYQQNKLAYIEQNESVVARYAYDQVGRVAEASDKVGTRSYQYHSDGRIRSITWGDQHYEIQTNQTGQIEQIISNGEQWIGIDYNPQGSVARIDRFFNHEYQPMEFNYDNRGFRTTTNYNGTEIDISYDMVGNLTSMSYPSEQGRAVDQYLVEENNELIQVLHAEESAVYIAYDAVGRPINITKGSRILSVEYDQAGRVVDVSMNGNPFVHKSYDSRESNADLDFEERGSSTTGAHPVDLSLEGSPFVNKNYDAMDSDAVLSSDKRTSFTTVPYPMASSIFGSIDGIVYSRLRGTAHGPVRFDAQMARFVMHSAPPVPDIVTLASLQRRMLTPLGREFVPSPFMFDKPSNSLFLPPEFASVNCQICLGDDTTTVALSAFTPFIAQQSESVYASVSGGSCTNFLDVQIPLAHRVTFGDGTSGYGYGSDITFNHIWSNPGLYTVSDSVTCSCWDPFAIPATASLNVPVITVTPPDPTRCSDSLDASWSDSVSASLTANNIASPFVQTIKTFFSYIGVRANISSASASVTRRTADCCTNPSSSSPPVNDGRKETTGSLQISVEVEKIVFVGKTIRFRDIDIGGSTLSVDVIIGVTYEDTADFKGSLGLRSNSCLTAENCGFGSVSGSMTPTIGATTTASGCLVIIGDASCTNLGVTAQTSMSLSGSLGYNESNCRAGRRGKLTLGEVTMSIKLSIPGNFSLGYSYTIFKGKEFPMS